MKILLILSKRLQAHLFQSVRLLILLTCMCLAQPFAALAQTNTPVPLPPAAQEALNNGILAAKLPDYLLAIRYFEEARKIAPKHPVIYLNLGLAESKISGRELRAIAWFGAYLAAYPGAPNAAAVKEQIAVLKVRNQSNTARLIKQVQTAAGQNEGLLGDVAGLWAKAGDVTEGLRTADLLQMNAKYAQPDIMKSMALNKVSRAQIGNGDLAGALMTANLIQDAGTKSETLLLVIEAQIKTGDITGAKKTISDVGDSRSWAKMSNLRRDIAILQAKAGDTAGSLATLAPENAKPANRQDYNLLSYTYSKIAELQIKSGDIAGTQKTISLAEAAMEQIKNQEYIGFSLSGLADKARYDIATVRSDLVKAQAMNGDIAGALKTADLLQDDAGYPRKSFALLHISEAQATSGDLAGARKTVVLIAHAGVKDQAADRIAKAKANPRSPVVKASMSPTPASQPPDRPRISDTDWITKLNDSEMSGDCPLNSRPFLDLAGYLQSLPSSDDPRQFFEKLRATADKLIRAQHIVYNMLEQQLKR